MSKCKTKEFISDITQSVKYWENHNDTKLRCLEGLAFSILVSLDGMSGSYDGDRNDLDPKVMLHDIFYEREEAEGK